MGAENRTSQSCLLLILCSFFFRFVILLQLKGRCDLVARFGLVWSDQCKRCPVQGCKSWGSQRCQIFYPTCHCRNFIQPTSLLPGPPACMCGVDHLSDPSSVPPQCSACLSKKKGVRAFSVCCAYAHLTSHPSHSPAGRRTASGQFSKGGRPLPICVFAWSRRAPSHRPSPSQEDEVCDLMMHFIIPQVQKEQNKTKSGMQP